MARKLLHILVPVAFASALPLAHRFYTRDEVARLLNLSAIGIGLIVAALMIYADFQVQKQIESHSHDPHMVRRMRQLLPTLRTVVGLSAVFTLYLAVNYPL